MPIKLLLKKDTRLWDPGPFATPKYKYLKKIGSSKLKQICPYLSLAHFSMFFTVTILLSGDSNGQAISPFHDIPLFANAEVGNLINVTLIMSNIM